MLFLVMPCNLGISRHEQSDTTRNEHTMSTHTDILAEMDAHLETLREDHDCSVCGGHLRALSHESVSAIAESSNFSSGHSVARCRLCSWTGPQRAAGLEGFQQAKADATAHNAEHGHS